MTNFEYMNKSIEIADIVIACVDTQIENKIENGDNKHLIINKAIELVADYYTKKTERSFNAFRADVFSSAISALKRPGFFDCFKKNNL